MVPTSTQGEFSRWIQMKNATSTQVERSFRKMAARLLHGRLFFFTVQTLIKIEIFRSRPLHRRSIHAEFKPLHRLNEVSKSRPLHRRSIHAEFKPLHSCQVIYSQFGLAIHQNDHQARRRFVERAQNEIAVVPDFHKRILFSDEAHFWLNGYVNKQNCRIWSEANPQVYVETPLHPEKLTVWCALWAGGIVLQKR
ncbi:hypothetical protein TNCV_3090091 [Trichonephila clavipes]|nr:hypothetical protein TNCV_3090091 [Trichonephila clavipes]